MKKNADSGLNISIENSKPWNKSEKFAANLSIWLKIFSYVIYGIFFAIVVSLQFISNPNQVGSANLIMVNTIIMFVFIFVGIVSMIAINFVADSYKRIWKIKFLFLHLINSILLVLIAAVITSFKISQTLPQTNEDLVFWALMAAIIISVQTLLLGVMIVIVGIQTKKSFPISWTRTLVAIPVLVSQIIIVFLLYAASSNFSLGSNTAGNANSGTVLLYVALAIAIISFIYSIAAFLVLSAFKTQLFSDKTNRELARIETNRDYKYFSLISVALILISTSIVFKFNSFSTNAFSFNIMFILNLIILLIAFSAYLFIMFRRNRAKNMSSKATDIQLKNMFTSNAFTWFFILTGAIFTYFSNSLGTTSSSTDIVITFAIFLLLKIIINIAAGFKFPNIKNATTTIISATIMLFVTLFALILLTIPNTSALKIFSTDSSMIILISIVFAGISINFIITTLSVQKAYYEGQNKKAKLIKRESVLEEQLKKINNIKVNN